MGRRKIKFNAVEDNVIKKLNERQTALKQNNNQLTFAKLAEQLLKIQGQAKQAYKNHGRAELSKFGLLTLQEAYDMLRQNGINITFRAFSGRIERKTIPTIIIGKRRYLSKDVVAHMIDLNNKFYKIREAYELYSSVKPINFRAFLGRIEKGAIPSVKIGHTKYIPKEVIETFLHVGKNYYTVKEVVDELRKLGVNIKRATIERRLDRGSIPFHKIGGKRYIHKDVANELINYELSKQKK
ncbi:MAG: helix-turn-helix domain-containing protein [Candidatus Anstonellales archaeon]